MQRTFCVKVIYLFFCKSTTAVINVFLHAFQICINVESIVWKWEKENFEQIIIQILIIILMMILKKKKYPNLN